MNARVLPVLVGLISLAACVDLSKGRPYRCEQDGECADGWQCLKDHYCHSPDAGADVPCVTTADDCTGGWICGNTKRCLDPAQPSDFPCADDSQCVGGWRCGGLGRCVDFSKEPQPSPFRVAGDVSVISPLTEPAPWLSMAPFFQRSDDGGVFTAMEVVYPRGEGAERLLFATRPEDKSGSSRSITVRSEVQLGFAPQALAATWGMFAAVRPDGGLELVEEDGGLTDVGLGFAPKRLAPLAWRAPDGSMVWSGLAALASDDGVVLFPDGQRFTVGAGVRDVAATWEVDGGLRLAVLKGSTELVTLINPFDPGDKTRVLVTTSGGPDTLDPDRLRIEDGEAVVSFNLSGFAAGRQGARVHCPGCADELGPMLTCTDSRPFSDFGAVPIDAPATSPRGVHAAPIAACESGSLIAGEGSGTLLDFREGVQAGTSGAHVRQLPTGQFLFSPRLGEETASVLSSRPRAVTLRRDAVLALAGGSLFAHTDDAGPGLALASTATADDEQIAGFVEGHELVVAARGFTLGALPDGGVQVEYFIDSPGYLGEETRARLLPTDAGRVFVVSDGDALYSAQRDEADPESFGVAEARVRPAAGFTLTDWALRGGASALLEGWAVANNRLFRLTATTVERWRASEVTFAARDPLAVWFAGDSALLGTASGEVLALPSGVPVAPALGDVLSIDGLCSTTIATTSTSGVFQLAASDGGLGEWRPLPTRALELPRVYVTDGHLLLTDEKGVVLDVPVSCP